jgi:hypothetical protein
MSMIPVTLCKSMARAEVDFGQDVSAPAIISIDAGVQEIAGI